MSDPVDDPAARSLVERLVALDEKLAPREQRLLRAMLAASLDPLDRRLHLGPGFDAEQQAVLARLEAARGGDDPGAPGAAP